MRAGRSYRPSGKHYQTVRGTGDEDPTAFSLIIFDGNYTTPAQLQANRGAARFLASGKPVVILNSTKAHLGTGLKDVVWAYVQGGLSVSPAVAFVLRRDHNGVPQRLVQVDFPVRMQTSASFPLTFQTFNSDTYNVQVVAWLPAAAVNGQQVLNPQSAWCLTPPNTSSVTANSGGASLPAICVFSIQLVVGSRPGRAGTPAPLLRETCPKNFWVL
jgi:hypothetical protein